MISKEKFIEYINRLKELNDACYELSNALQKFGCDNEVFPFTYETLIIDVLQGMFKDVENDWIGYALYELDWFSEYRDGTITVDGKDVPLRDAGDLYDLLVENMGLDNVCDV